MRKSLITFFPAYFLMISIFPAKSDEIPTLDVMPLCRGIISQGDAPLQAGDRAVTMEECLKAEQHGSRNNKKEWPQFSALDKQHCVAEAKMGGESSYTELLTCLEMARDVRQMKLQPAGSDKID